MKRFSLISTFLFEWIENHLIIPPLHRLFYPTNTFSFISPIVIQLARLFPSSASRTRLMACLSPSGSQHNLERSGNSWILKIEDGSMPNLWSLAPPQQNFNNELQLSIQSRKFQEGPRQYPLSSIPSKIVNEIPWHSFPWSSLKTLSWIPKVYCSRPTSPQISDAQLMTPSQEPYPSK